MLNVAGVRRTGSAALDIAWTAAGRFDCYWERNIKPWDMAAGIVMIRESGGTVSDLEGSDQMMDTGGIITVNKDVHRLLLPLLVHPTAPIVSAR